MVDLAIASTFARELTEDQFTEERKPARRRRAARSAFSPAARAGSATRRAPQVESGATRGRRARPAGSARSMLARVMSRLVQVRG
jgi:hypothetical protein